MKITKGMTIKVLLISYKYTDKSINPGSIGQKIKNYYENNSRNTVTIKLTSVAYKVPFTKNQVNKAVDYVKNIMPKGYDVYVHFCNPKISHTGGGNVITYASTTNAVHEFGHALGLSHANSLLSGEFKRSRDPFDQMTIFAPYPSTNAVHRYQLDWFLPGEFIEYDASRSKYTLGMLKNFADKKSTKVIFYKTPDVNDPTKMKRFFLSYGAKNGFDYVTIHTIYGKNSSVILAMYKVIKGRIYTNEDSGITIKIDSESDNLVNFTLTTKDSVLRSANEEHYHKDEDDECENCQLNNIEDYMEDNIDNEDN